MVPFCVKKETIKKIPKKNTYDMIETLPDSAPVFHFGSDPTIDGRCSEGVSRAGSRGRVLNFYDDTEQGGKEPRCQEGDQAEATRKIDKNRAFHRY